MQMIHRHIFYDISTLRILTFSGFYEVHCLRSENFLKTGQVDFGLYESDIHEIQLKNLRLLINLSFKLKILVSTLSHSVLR